GAGVASAIGMLVAPRSIEFTRSLIVALDALDWSAVDAILAELRARAEAVLVESGARAAEIVTEVTAEMRYAGQGFEVAVALDASAPPRRDTAALRRAFDTRYQERFGRNLGALPVEVVSWRVRLLAPPSVDRIRFDATQSGDSS